MFLILCQPVKSACGHRPNTGSNSRDAGQRHGPAGPSPLATGPCLTLSRWSEEFSSEDGVPGCNRSDLGAP